MRRTRSHHGFSSPSCHRELLLLLAAAVLALFLLYGCTTGGPVYGPQGRLIFLPLAQSGGIAKNHPDAADLKNAVSFYNGLH